MVNKDSEVLFDFLIDAFRLPVHLWMERRGSVWGNIEHPVEFFHELGDELGSSVRYYDLGHSVLRIDVVSECSSPSLC